jgi:SWI/SNF-related matrix-associated actin-dependent regulator of chromatin subfamily A member 5
MERLLEATDEYLSKIMNRGQVHTHANNSGSNVSMREQHMQDTPESEEEETEEEEFVITSQPSLIQGEMRNYQIEGLDWLAQLTRNGVNGILADEMGLGKTLQSISILALVKERKWPEDAYPHLVIVPKSTITNWEKEFARFCPVFRTCCLIGSQEEREHLIQTRIDTRDFDVLITSFDIARIEIAALRRIRFGFFILDEAHRIKNEESILSSVVRMIKAERILLLTGTPLQNNLHELWAILNFVMPHIFASSQDFDEIFQQLSIAGNQEAVASTLHRILRPFMLRRLKTDVARDLPDKKELYVYVSLSRMQREIYRDIVLKNADSILNTNSVGKVRLVNTLMQLRKACNHPYLFPGVEPGPPFIDGPHLVENSGKLAVVDKLIDKILIEKAYEKNQILIFSQMTKVLDILDDYLRFKRIAHCRIDGSTASSDRQSMIDDFVNPNTDKRVFLLSTRAGGLGINLVSANFVFIFDADFNPQSDLQAIDRAHRIGQKRPVTVYRFVTKNTVEEKIVEKAAKKLLIDRLVIQKGKFGGRSAQGSDENVSKDEMAHILRFGVSELFTGNDNSVESSTDIEALMEFSERKTSELTDKLKSFDSFVLKFENPLTASLVEEEAEKEFVPEEVRIAAENIVPEPAEGVVLVDGPRERKQIIQAVPKRTTAPPVIKTKLAEWRAKVGGGHDYQFFDNSRLDELEKIEKEKGVLTCYEKAERDKLMSEGFPNFSRRCFQTVVRLLEEYGPSTETTDQIVEALPEWPREELERYIDVLFTDGKKFLGNHFMVRFMNKIKKIEQENADIDAKMAALDRKIEAFKGKNIWTDLAVDSPHIPENSGWTNEVDRILLCGTYCHRYGAWNNIRAMLRTFPRTAMNWAVHVKSVEELKGRVNELLEIVEEEFPAPKKGAKRKK